MIFGAKGMNSSDLSKITTANYNFDTVTDLLADTTLTYTAASGKYVVSAGDYITAQGFRYKVADSAATDHHVATAGGVKLYVQPTQSGEMAVDAWGAVADGATDNASIIQAAATAAQDGNLGSLRFGDGRYNVGVGIAVTRYLNFIGAGARATFLTGTGDFDVLTFDMIGGDNVTRECVVQDMTIDSTASTGTGRGIYLDNPSRFAFHRVRVANHKGAGVVANRNTGYDFLLGFYDCYFSNNGDWGVDIDNINSAVFSNCSWQGNVGELRFDGQSVLVLGGYVGGTAATSGGAIEIAGATGSPGQSGGALIGVDFENNGNADAHVYVGSVNTVKGFSIQNCFWTNPSGGSGNISCVKAKLFKELTISGGNMFKSGTFTGTVKGIELPAGSSTVTGLRVMGVLFTGLDTDIDNTGGASYLHIIEDELRLVGAADAQLSIWQPGDANPRLRINGDGTMDWSDGAAAPDVTLFRHSAGKIGPPNGQFLRAETIVMGASGGSRILQGNGSPEGVVTANPGSQYMRGDGGAGTCFYVKESGTGNTGWVAK